MSLAALVEVRCTLIDLLGLVHHSSETVERCRIGILRFRYGLVGRTMRAEIRMSLQSWTVAVAQL